MKTKTFKNVVWGTEKELTRDEYIQEWLDATIQFGTLFGGDPVTAKKFWDMRDTVGEQAGINWDNH